MSKLLLMGVAERQPLTIGSQPLAMAIERGVSDGAQRLIWQEFFVSRGRGIDWATHLPWATNGNVLCACATVTTANGAVVAALLIRPVPGTATAMIGCVCVDPLFRGHGLSRRLIDLTAMPLRRLGIDRMLLWTVKPRVYERAGFVIVAHERRLALCGATANRATPVTLKPWPIADAANDDTATGLPPFASTGWRATSLNAQVFFVDTPTGAALLDHSGAPDAVLSTMFAARPGSWAATLGVEHPLRRLAVMHSACVEDTPGPVTMYRALGADMTPPAYVPPAFRI